jgi:hypothetical protein
MLRNCFSDQFPVLVVERSLRAKQARAVLAAPHVGRVTRRAVCLVQPLAAREHVLGRQRPRKLTETAAPPTAPAASRSAAAPTTTSPRRRVCGLLAPGSGRARCEIAGQIRQHLVELRRRALRTRPNHLLNLRVPFVPALSMLEDDVRVVTSRAEAQRRVLAGAVRELLCERGRGAKQRRDQDQSVPWT